MADAEPRTRAANQRAVTDGKIQGAALRLLATVGTDGLSLPAIAKESGLTTGPVYARYGGVDDVLVVIWDLYLRDALVRVLALQAAWVNGEDPMPDELRDLFESPSQEMNALVEVMATVRRYPFAYEVISVQIEECFTTIAAQYSHVPRSQLQLQLGFVLGAVFAMPIMPSALVDNFIEAEHLLRMMARSREGWDARSAQIDTFVVPIPIVDVEEPVRKAFLTGALNTIAITGVEGASAQRIARASGYGFSTAYNYFQSKEQLAEEAIRIVMFQLFQLNVNVNRIQNREAYINAVIAI
ncbi:MAG: TetR/AcrR family transcriptional regulator, partial [Actinobacteria bacterium]|nr:TetR/AcrR family transcriptional regulator [Actinomycetota bacterium]